MTRCIKEPERNIPVVHETVIVENKDGRQAIASKQFVDATGDGDLALSLGLPSLEPETLQPPTTCAKLMGLNALGDTDWVAAVRDHGPEFGLSPDWGWGAHIPGLPGIEMRADTHVFGVDTTRADDLTRAEMEGRRQVRAIPGWNRGGDTGTRHAAAPRALA